MKTRICALLLAACLLVASSAQPRSSRASDHYPVTKVRPRVTRAEYDRWKTELSNWGRWGTNDQSGALNLVTDVKRKQAAALVHTGVSVSLAVDANEQQAEDNPSPYQRVMMQAGRGGSMDQFTVAFHGMAHTHIDALSHRVLDDKIYNFFSGYVGGMRYVPAKEVLAKKPEHLIKQAVAGMLPKSPLGRQLIKKLKIYPGAEHPHKAQTPKKMDF